MIQTSARRQLRRHECRTGEDEGVTWGQVRQQEIPGLFGMCVRQVSADVASPGDASTLTHQMGGQTGRLGIVEDHDVAGLDPGQRSSIGLEGGIVVRVLISAERSGISRRSVEAVVQSLGYRKELGVGVDDDPTGID